MRGSVLPHLDTYKGEGYAEFLAGLTYIPMAPNTKDPGAVTGPPPGGAAAWAYDWARPDTHIAVVMPRTPTLVVVALDPEHGSRWVTVELTSGVMIEG
jgi:hypothetical protein